MIVTSNEVHKWTNELFDSGQGGVAVAILLGGDRLICCDEASLIKAPLAQAALVQGDERSKQIVGACTIAPRGETGNGRPELVGLYVLPSQRRKGYGLALLTEAINRCNERRLTPVTVCVITKPGLATIQKLPPELLALTTIIDHSNWDMGSLNR